MSDHFPQFLMFLETLRLSMSMRFASNDPEHLCCCFCFFCGARHSLRQGSQLIPVQRRRFLQLQSSQQDLTQLKSTKTAVNGKRMALGCKTGHQKGYETGEHQTAPRNMDLSDIHSINRPYRLSCPSNYQRWHIGP